MKLENTADRDHMASPFCFFNKPSSWIVAALVVSLIFCAFLGFDFSSVLLTSVLILIISTSLFFTFAKQKPVTEEINLNSDHQETTTSPRVEDGLSVKQLPENESVKLQKEGEEEEEEEIEHQIVHDYSVKSPDLLSESESFNRLSSSEESELDWPFREIIYQSPDCSDGSISDEESDLIEISLPSGHYLPNKFNLQQQKVAADFSTHSILKQQHSLMELLAEINDMNEEENLIEIDISMGSIKCSSFEIEA